MRAVADLSSLGVDVWILQGNHDYLRRGHAYFAFLDVLPGVRFVTTPTEIEDDGKGPLAFLLPHSREPMLDWAELDLSHYDLAFMHQTVSGAVASNGQRMDGERLPMMAAGKVWSGDIHVPQVIGGVEYVGSPYHVRFGDAFEPRCVLLPTRGAPVDLRLNAPQRRMIDVASIDELVMGLSFLRPGDQVKVRFRMDRADMHRWRSVETECRGLLTAGELDVHGIEMRLRGGEVRGMPVEAPNRALAEVSDEAAVLTFVESNELGGDVYDAGLEVMKS